MHPSPHVLEYIAVPQFDSENLIHTRLSTLSQRAHKLADSGDEAGLTETEARVDEAAVELWNITAQELEDTRRSLGELR